MGLWRTCESTWTIYRVCSGRALTCCFCISPTSSTLPPSPPPPSSSSSSTWSLRSLVCLFLILNRSRNLRTLTHAHTFEFARTRVFIKLLRSVRSTNFFLCCWWSVVVFCALAILYNFVILLLLFRLSFGIVSCSRKKNSKNHQRSIHGLLICLWIRL